MFSLAPKTQGVSSPRGANTGRGRYCWSPLTLLASISIAASPAFSYTDNLDSYLASKFIVPIADIYLDVAAKSHFKQYMREAGLPSDMLRYYEPHPFGPGPHPFSSFCCNWNDCGFAKPGSVTWTPEGYRVRMPDGHFQIVPEDSAAIRFQYEKGHEKEARFGACILPKGAAIDAYLENISPGALQSQSAWYVRCLYIGRSGQ